MANDNLGDDPITRFVNLLKLLLEKFLVSYQIGVIILATLFFLIVGALLLIFR